MKKHLGILSFLAVAVFMLSAMPIHAAVAVNETKQEIDTKSGSSAVVDSGQCGDHTYWVLTDDMTLTVSGKGTVTADIADFAGKYKGDIKKLIIEDGITAMNNQNYFVVHFDSLESVYIANTVTGIYSDGDCGNDSSAMFAFCKSLKEIELMSSADYDTGLGIHTFWNCSSLENVVMPASIKSKKYGLHETFKGCASLKSIWFPADIETFEWLYLTDSCPNLTDVYYPGSREMFLKIPYSKAIAAKVKLHTYCCYLPYCTFSASYSTCGYTGKPITPKIKVVTPSGTTLKEGKNYTVTYKDNVGPGKAYAYITGIGKYSGTYVYSFNILPKKVMNIKASDIRSDRAVISWSEHPFADKYYIYNGSKLKGETTSTSFTLYGLKPHFTRKVYVRAVMLRENEFGEMEEYIGMGNYVTVTTPS